MLQEILKIAPEGIMGPKTLEAIKSYEGNLAKNPEAQRETNSTK